MGARHWALLALVLMVPARVGAGEIFQHSDTATGNQVYAWVLTRLGTSDLRQREILRYGAKTDDRNLPLLTVKDHPPRAARVASHLRTIAWRRLSSGKRQASQAAILLRSIGTTIKEMKNPAIASELFWA